MVNIVYNEMSDLKVAADIKTAFSKRPKIGHGIVDTSYFSGNNQIYINTNDQTKEVTSDISGGDVLTVASSGDYLLDCVLQGTNNIVTYDINDFQYYATCLKLWALQTLDYDEYISFFTDRSSDKFLSSSLLEKIIEPFIKDPAYKYWDTFRTYRQLEEKQSDALLRDGIPADTVIKLFMELEEIFENNPNAMGDIEALFKNQTTFIQGSLLRAKDYIAARTIQYPEVNPNIIGHMSSKENFDLTRRNLNNVLITFENSDLLSLPAKLAGQKFDIAFLSNIPFYLDGYELFTSIDNLQSTLYDDGVISYYYHNFKKSWFESGRKMTDFIPPESAECIQYEYAIGEALAAYDFLCSSGFNVEVTELGTTSSVSSKINIESDVKCLVRKNVT
jgi:hypothetical protein